MISEQYGDRPRVGAVLIGCLVGFLLGQILAGVLVSVAAQLAHFPGGYRALSGSSAPPWWSNALGLVGLWCGFGGSIYFARTRGRLAALPRQWQPRVSDVAYVLLGVGSQFVLDLLYYPFHFKNLSGPSTHLFGSARGTTFVLMVVLTTFVAPVAEEWFFRGVLYRTLDEGLKSVAPRIAGGGAVVISACLFALAHGEPLQFAGLALFGVVLALVIRRTQRLVPSIVTHISFNAVAMVTLIVQRSGH
jgi:membrane protease YdiL (CAAX protease family)